MPLKNGIKKSGYVEEASGIASTISSSSEDVGDSRDLPWLTQRIVQLELRVTFNASATDGARLKIYQSMDDTNYDTEVPTDLVGDIAVSAGNTCQKTFFFEIASPYYQPVVENLDGTYDLTFVHLKVLEFPEME